MASSNYIFDIDSYGHAVLEGRIPASKYTIAGVARHYDDLKHAKERGLYFSEAHAQHALETFLFTKHSKGEFAGQDFIPSPWQIFWTAVMFGWLRRDGTRRFREVWIEVPRKNGKTTWIAVIGIHVFYFDGEGGSEVYACATKMDQAKILHSEAVRMVINSPFLRKHIGVRTNEIYNRSLGTADVFKPLGRDSKSLDGLNPHCGLFDEKHAHPNSEIYDVIKSGVGARLQALLVSITTAGFDLSSFGYQEHLYAKQVLDGVFQPGETDDFLAIIYTVDDQNDWTNPLEWQKANPNWGVTVFEDRMAIACGNAIRKSGEEANFKTKNLNIWLASGSAWIRHEDWQGCGDPSLDMADFKDCPCWAGLDLAEKSDIAALCIVFKRGGDFYVFFKFYLNEFQVNLDGNEHFARWAKQGQLIVTDGNSTDFDVIADDLRDIREDFDLQEVGFDPKFAAYFAATLLEEGLPMVEINQSGGHFTLPIIEIENYVLDGKLHHQGWDSMAWQMANVVMQISRFTQLKHPTKENNALKIDGPVSMIMAFGRAFLGGGGEAMSFWETDENAE